MPFCARILGAAAGGGLPQWNCGCDNCNAARRGEIPSQTQSSLAVTGDARHWALLNASPDIRQQLNETAALAPTGLREMPLCSVLVTNGDIDHIAGLLTLREMHPFTLFATAGIHEVIASNRIFDALRDQVVTRTVIELNTPFELAPGLMATLFPVPGKVPLFLEGNNVQTDLEGEQTVGVELSARGARVCYIPGCARLTEHLRDRLEGCDLLFFDGTVWDDDEMIKTGTGQKTGQRMGHMSMNGPNGSLAAFRDLAIRRKTYIHMNNTNPVFRPGSPERAEVEANGWIIGQDGMEFCL